ncbi:MAG: GDSL-type esterase/lipase family protein [Planctomycetota bacterium]
MSPKKLCTLSIPSFLISGAVAYWIVTATSPAPVAPPAATGGAAARPSIPVDEAQRKRIASALEDDLDAIEAASPIHGFDPDLGWVHRPGSGQHGAVMAMINERGGRGPAPAGKDANALAVVCYGESFTFGSEVPDADCWPSILDASGADVAVWNLGVGGYGTDQAVLRFRATIDDFEPDVVLFGFMTENIARNVNRYRTVLYPNSTMPIVKPRFILRDGELELVPIPFRLRSEVYRAVLDDALAAAIAPHEFWLTGNPEDARGAQRWIRFYGDLESEPARVSLALLETACAEARAAGADRAAVVLFPTKNAFRRLARGVKPYWTEFAETLEARGVTVIDGAGALLAAVESGAKPDDLYLRAHLSRAGNEAIAVRVGEWVRAR